MDKVGTLDGTTVYAATATEGRGLLSRVDAFVSSQSTFDRQARLCLQSSTAVVTEAMYLDYVGAQAMDWSTEELATLVSIFTGLGPTLQPYGLNLPSQVFLVKTTGKEEGYAAYTRQNNVVVLPANMVASLFAAEDYGDPLHPATSTTYLTDVIIHELFHLFSKNNPQQRWELYRKVGYQPTGCNVALPEVPWPAADSRSTMADLRITNPDTPTIDTYIALSVPTGTAEKASAAQSTVRPVVPVLLATGPYAGGSFFDYLEWWFLAVVGGPGQWRVDLDGNGRPVAYRSAPLMQQYLQIIGRNFSSELFHPDEILAQNWVLVATQPSLGLLVDIADTLAPGRAPGTANTSSPSVH